MKRRVCICLLFGLLMGCKEKPAISDGSAPVSQPVTRQSSQPPAQTSATSTATPTAGSGPRWGWQKYDEESFETQPSQGRVFAVPENATRLKVKLTATSPVDSAAMTRQVFKSAKGVVREDRLVRLPCASIGVRQDEAACSLNPKDSVVYVVRDRRALSADPVAMAMLEKTAKKHGSGPALLAVDKVHVVLSVWTCVANCGVLGGPAQ